MAVWFKTPLPGRPDCGDDPCDDGGGGGDWYCIARNFYACADEWCLVPIATYYLCTQYPQTTCQSHCSPDIPEERRHRWKDVIQGSHATQAACEASCSAPPP